MTVRAGYDAPMYIDSHCHLSFPELLGDITALVGGARECARRVGIGLDEGVQLRRALDASEQFVDDLERRDLAAVEHLPELSQSFPGNRHGGLRLLRTHARRRRRPEGVRCYPKEGRRDRIRGAGVSTSW